MGSSVRRFNFGRCLGRGSFGEVYAATMRSPGGLESEVAVKLLRAEVDLNDQAVRRLRDEGRLLARLNHPAILKVVDFVTIRGRLALITELVEGADLADFAAPRVSIPVRALVQAVSQVASALDAACNTKGPDGPLKLVHRDVKPSNIRIERHGQAKLLDFGIARFDAADREVRTASGLVVGSVPYMAPERFLRREVEASSDVFSLGCVLYEGITGTRLYGETNVAGISTLAMNPDKFRRHMEERIGALPVAGGLRELMRELVEIEPAARPSAGEAAGRLEKLADVISGPTLRMWCRGREWAEMRTVPGAFEGQVLEEGSAALPSLAPGSAGPVINRAPIETAELGGGAPPSPAVGPRSASSQSTEIYSGSLSTDPPDSPSGSGCLWGSVALAVVLLVLVVAAALGVLLLLPGLWMLVAS